MQIKLKQLTIIVIMFVIIFNCKYRTNDQVDKLFEIYNQENVPGAAVLIIHNSRKILTKMYGMANLEKKESVTCSTNFRLASVTKQFTAMCILILIERGKLEYDTTIKEIYPNFPNYGKQITIRHLLQHTSGLIDYEGITRDTANLQITDNGVLNMMMQIDGTYFLPGTSYRYSDSGYAVLATIIEKLSKRTFAEFLNENIFLPLGMKNSLAYDRSNSTVPSRAYGYTVIFDSARLSDQSLTSAVLGDGGIYSSINDLYKWDQALYTDMLISSETLKLAFTPGLGKYGFGWKIDEYKGHLRIRHAGNTSGFSTAIERFPDDKFTVIILTNRKYPIVTYFAERLTDLFLIEKRLF